MQKATILIIMLNLAIVSGCGDRKESSKYYLKLANKSHENAEQYLERLKIELNDLTPKKIKTYQRGYREEKQREIRAYEKVVRINPHIIEEDDYIKLGEAYLGILDESKPSIQTPSEKKAIFGKAIRSFESALKINPKNVKAYVWLSSTYLHAKQYDRAMEECKRLLSLDPKNADAYAIIGNIFRLSGEYDLAEENFQKAIEIDPKCIKARLSLVPIYLEKEEVNRALDELKKILEIDQKNWEATQLLRVIRDAASTASKIEEALKENPKNVPLLVELGRAYTTLTNYPKAMEAYEKAYYLQPKEDISIVFELGQVLLFDYSKNKEKVKRAIEILEKAKASDPKDTQIRITLAEAYKTIRAYDKTVKECKEILSEEPKYALAWYYLGEAYEAMGNKRKADEAFKKSVKLTIALDEEILSGE